MKVFGYDTLNQEEQKNVDEQLKHIDIEDVKHTYESVYLNKSEEDFKVSEVPFVTKDQVDVEELKNNANNAFKRGEVAVLLMAGGQGTRLGYTGPKGTFDFDGTSLFEFQSRHIKRVSEHFKPVDWYIMTSDINHEATLKFFKDHNYFSLNESQVHFFKQDTYPPLSKAGELLLTESKDIMLTPNGNGGIFNALKTSGMLQDMKDKGIKHVFMNNIDNVVVKVLDPTFVGLHVKGDYEITSKSIIPKAHESVGRLSLKDGNLGVVEYTEIPKGKDSEFKNGNIGIHMFSLNYIDQVAEKKLPYHLALKKLNILTENSFMKKEEVLKFELFYFDAFQYATHHKTLQVDREGEFSPLKNKEGKDSIETARESLKEAGLL